MFAVAPSPSWPSPSLPHEYADPVDVRAPLTEGTPDHGRGGAAADPGLGGGSTTDGSDTEAVTSLSVLTDSPPSDAVSRRGAVPVPLLTSVALGLCVGFTVVFGIVPEPILDFAHQATLLFT